MAKLDITEYTSLATDRSGRVIMAGAEPAITTQQLTVGAEADQSDAFSDATSFVRLHADTACRIAISDDPTADATSMRIAANGTEYLGVRPGMKLSVIATT